MILESKKHDGKFLIFWTVFFITTFLVFDISVGFAMGDLFKPAVMPAKPISNQQEVEKEPEGPCGWFNPEGCPEYVVPDGCTTDRRNTIDNTAVEYPYVNFLGEPVSDYVEIDVGCKRDFEQGTIYVGSNTRRGMVLSGPIRDFYASIDETSSALGWPQSVRVDIPTTTLATGDCDFMAIPHRFQFTNGWVYWHPDYENPIIVMDRIHDFFQRQGGTSELGFPINNESLDSHEGEMLFQAFDRAIIFENFHENLEIFRDDVLDLYLAAAGEYGLHHIDDPLDAEAELGLPYSNYLATPKGSVRLLHHGTIYYRDGREIAVFPDFFAMIDGRIVHGETFAVGDMMTAIVGDPYLADYRKNVVLEALNHEGLCGDEARESIGTISEEYCSEFVREVYETAGVDSWLCGKGICLWTVTYAKQLRWIFEDNSSFVYASHADILTAEPGDYLSMWGEDHSALVVAASIDGRNLWRVGGNEGSDECVNFSRDTYFDESGIINSDFYGFGKLDASFFD